ncbi:MAG TPA: monovalent cation:proton antiporter-2 (CPA2) family protein, partial [Arenibaculum sp.]|nr:monovalent cation:proton antiporter-2 (CPA2) family protein [Arenibaculum sp.]
MDLLLTLVVLLGAAVVAVPVTRRLGLGSVLGYLAAGLVIGPSGFGLIADVESIAHVSELGVVMLLFLIGLELRPARLWVMRRAVFGLGSAQVVLTSALIALAAYAFGLGAGAAIVLGAGWALSSTALVLPLLVERELMNTQAGRDGFSVLLFQDLAIIPMLAALPLLGDNGIGTGTPWLAVLKTVAVLALVLVGGRYLTRPVFRAAAGTRAPEIFTATALLVVVGTAALVGAVGLSMSLGAFMAGVLLSNSEFRHQLQADIEPFEGLLLGLFFVSVGMGTDLGVLMADPLTVTGLALTLLAVKG